MRRTWPIVLDAANHFLAEDGWAIASHIALVDADVALSLPDLRHRAGGLPRHARPGGRGDASDLRRLAGRGRRADRRRSSQRADGAARRLADRSARCSRSISPRARSKLCAPASTAPTPVRRRGRGGCCGCNPSPSCSSRSLALLALAFLVVLGPLIWAAALRFAPALAPLQSVVTFARLGVATLLLAITLLIAHRWLPAERLRLVDIAPGVDRDLRRQHRLRRGHRRLLERIRAQLRLDLRRPGVGDDRAGVPLRDGRDVRVRRRAERGDHARAPRPARVRVRARAAGHAPANAQTSPGTSQPASRRAQASTKRSGWRPAAAAVAST